MRCAIRSPGRSSRASTRFRAAANPRAPLGRCSRASSPRTSRATAKETSECSRSPRARAASASRRWPWARGASSTTATPRSSAGGPSTATCSARSAAAAALWEGLLRRTSWSVWVATVKRQRGSCGRGYVCIFTAAPCLAANAPWCRSTTPARARSCESSRRSTRSAAVARRNPLHSGIGTGPAPNPQAACRRTRSRRASASTAVVC
mmetsp:Transcript_70483/g.201899  ORF Transcript_70483/g.201899 Transcript_70483/m.201899 type:complete len:207 (-) Transcript_70483:845-1465(-)